MQSRSPAAYWRFEIATATLRPSDHCRALHGLPPEAAFSYADYLDSIHPEDRPEFFEALDRAINLTGRLDASYRVVWPDGSVHRVRALGSVSPGDDGAPLEIVGASVEVTTFVPAISP